MAAGASRAGEAAAPVTSGDRGETPADCCSTCGFPCAPATTKRDALKNGSIEFILVYVVSVAVLVFTLRLPFVVKALPHTEHLNGRSPV